jgi:hypothetical protein
MNTISTPAPTAGKRLRRVDAPERGQRCRAQRQRSPHMRGGNRSHHRVQRQHHERQQHVRHRRIDRGSAIQQLERHLDHSGLQQRGVDDALVLQQNDPRRAAHEQRRSRTAAVPARAVFSVRVGSDASMYASGYPSAGQRMVTAAAMLNVRNSTCTKIFSSAGAPMNLPPTVRRRSTAARTRSEVSGPGT